MDFSLEWRQFAQDLWVQEVVAKGYAIEFLDLPPAPSGVRITPVPRKSSARSALYQEVGELLAKRAIEYVPRQQQGQGFYSTFFVVPKKPEGLRPILNLKPFNVFVKRTGFKLDSIRTVRNELRPGDMAVSIDLKDAYYHIPIAFHSKQYLRFCFGGAHFQFRALPFGLSSSPRTFCKCLAPILGWCHSQGFRVMAYLDDWLLIHPDRETLASQSQQLLRLLERLGWIVSYKKSRLAPSLQFPFLGVDFDTRNNAMAPSRDRIANLSHMARRLLDYPAASALTFLEVLGHMASMIEILPTTRLRMRNIQMCLLHQWKAQLESPYKIIWVYQTARDDLLWWMDPTNMVQGAPIWPAETQTTILTDASLEGWGAHCEELAIQGMWTREEASQHINFLEMMTVLIALQRWQKFLQGKSILIRSDNTTVVQYLNKQGGTISPRLCRLSMYIWETVLQNNMWIKAAHIAGKDNVLADDLSRGRKMVTSDEWSLCPQTTQWIFEVLGRPLVDLFAYKGNNKLPTYCSWKRDREAWRIDALSIPWEKMWAYAFPPQALIPRVLAHAARYNCSLLLVAPRWEKRPWLATILLMLEDFPLELPVHQHLLKFPGWNRFHPEPGFLKLTVWPISGAKSRCEAFRKQLRDSSWRPGDPVHKGSMVLSTKSSPAGVVEGAPIPLMQASN